MENIYEVKGLALAPVEVRYTVKAKNEDDAKEIAEKLFKSGKIGDITYTDDDKAASDFEAQEAHQTDEDEDSLVIYN